MHRALFVAGATVGAMGAFAGPVPTVVDVAGPDDTVSVAGAAFGGLFAIGDSFQDRVEVRSRDGGVIRAISRSELQALAPWLNLDGGPDGPSALAFTPTGSQLFITVHDDTLPGDGLGSDVVLRLDLGTGTGPGTVSLFARANLFDRGDQWPHLASVQFRSVLYVGGSDGTIRAYLASSGSAAGSLLATWTIPGGGSVRGLTVDRDTGMLFAATPGAVYRTALTNSFSSPPTWSTVTSSVAGLDVRGLAWADAYGGSGEKGLYIVGAAAGGAGIAFVSAAGAYWVAPVAATTYATTSVAWHGIAATGDGRLIVASEDNATSLRDSNETALPFDAWKLDEIQQAVTFGRGLISPDGEPAGWVIDADVPPGNARFHPATPDGAAWTVLLLLASDRVLGDATAQASVRTVLTRYAGFAPDGIRPSRTADGIFRHWIDPLTGQAKSGWDPEFATLSTMKMVFAAGRAMAAYPDDPVIARAGSRIIFGVKNWDAYVRASDRAMFFGGLAGGGADAGSVTGPWHEGVIFVDQAATYAGSVNAALVRGTWLTRSGLPSASYLSGVPVTTNANGAFSSAFISVYPALVMPGYRESSEWRAQVANLRRSHTAWTDDAGPQYSTVFSAGTTRSDWGGYHADSLSSHPGDVTTFTSLLGFAAFGDERPAVEGYHAYRKGARQAWKTGASLLYRRSNVDRAYVPNSAGLPDVALGALGLTELVSPGFIDRVLAQPDPRAEMSPVDRTGDGRLNIDDLYAAEAAPSDLNGDGVVMPGEAQLMENWLRRREAADLTR